jgi:hypothetical protein
MLDKNKVWKRVFLLDEAWFILSGNLDKVNFYAARDTLLTC